MLIASETKYLGINIEVALALKTEHNLTVEKYTMYGDLIIKHS